MRRGLSTGVLLLVTLAVSMLTLQGSPSPLGEGKEAQPVTNSTALSTPSLQEAKNCHFVTDAACTQCDQLCPERRLLDLVVGYFGQQPGDKEAAKHWGDPARAQHEIRFVVAVVPDPIHTHLSLFFDRSIDAIVQAAQQDGYVLDRAAMPWDPREHPESTDYRVRQGQEQFEKIAEELPGLMIFRPANPDIATNSPGVVGTATTNTALFVFTVGETPTSGIHKDQFENALRKNAVQPVQSICTASGVCLRDAADSTTPQVSDNGSFVPVLSGCQFCRWSRPSGRHRIAPL